MADNEDIRSWGSNEGLPNYVIDILQHQGINSADDVKNLPDDMLLMLGLTETQYDQLKEAVDRLRGAGGEQALYDAGPPSERAYTSDLSQLSVAEDLRSWGRKKNLPNYVIDILQQQGINSTDDVKNLPDDMLLMLELPATQYDQLKEAIDSLRGAGCSSPGGEQAYAYAPERMSTNIREFLQTGEKEGQETFRIVLLGKTGCGKSTTGNTILGKKAFDVGADFASVTADCKREVASRQNIKLEVLDCPGLFDTKTSQEAISMNVIQAVAALYPGPHAFLYVVRIGRYTEEEHGAYRRLKSLFDARVTNHMILLFTGGDSLDGIMGSDASSEVAKRIREKGPKTLQDVFRECGQRTVVFDNMATEKDSQINYLLEQVRIMTGKNGGQPYVCPKYAYVGQSVEEEVSRRIEKIEKEDAQRKKYVQQLEKDKKSTEEDLVKTKEQIKRVEKEKEQKEKESLEKTRKLEADYAEKLNEQKQLADQQQTQLNRIMEENKAAERTMREREHEMNERERQRMKEEAERRQQEQDRLMKEMEAQRQQAQLEKGAYQTQMQQMQQQHTAMMAKMDGERKAEIQELRRQEAQAEERRDRQRQQERLEDERRHQMTMRELERVKQDASRNKGGGCCIS